MARKGKSRKGKGKGKGKAAGLGATAESAAPSKSGHSGTGTELARPLVIVGGLLLGNFIGKGIDKVIPVPEDATGFQIKSLVKPLLQAGAGVAIILLSREKPNEAKKFKILKGLARNLGYGVAGSGVISGVKLIKADLFEGLGDTGNPENKPIEAKYFREAKNEIMKMLKDSSFRPELPSPAGKEGEENRSEGGESRNEEVLGLLTEDTDAEIL